MIGVIDILNILTAISILAIVAIGLYIVFGLMNVINMAHGDMMMIGAFSTLTLTSFGINFWVSVLLSGLIVAALGALVERSVIRYLYQTGALSTMLATWGLGIVLQQTIRLTYGPQGQFVELPTLSMTNIFGVQYPTYRLLLLIISLLIFIILFIILRKTKIGLIIRATMDQPTVAETMGINTKQVYFIGFVIGSFLAGIAGALIAPITNVSPLMGLDYVVKSFLAVIVGGVQSMLSVVGGATIIEGILNLLNIYIDATVAWIIVLSIIIITIWIRPKGVFSRR